MSVVPGLEVELGVSVGVGEGSGSGSGVTGISSKTASMVWLATTEEKA